MKYIYLKLCLQHEFNEFIPEPQHEYNEFIPETPLLMSATRYWCPLAHVFVFVIGREVTEL